MHSVQVANTSDSSRVDSGSRLELSIRVEKVFCCNWNNNIEKNSVSLSSSWEKVEI